MKKTIFWGSLTALSFGIFGFLIFQIFPKFLLTLFNQDPQLLKIGIPALKRVSLSYFFMVLNILGVATFQALGKGFPSFLITFLRQVILLLSSMYLLGQFFGLKATWLAFPLAEATSFLVLSSWLFLTLKNSVNKMRTISTSQS